MACATGERLFKPGQQVRGQQWRIGIGRELPVR
jgi:hypothetical protein